MTNFEDLRRIANEEDNDPVGMNIDLDELFASQSPPTPQRPFLGMSAGQRAFLSVVIFLNVLILGAGLLFVTGRFAF